MHLLLAGPVFAALVAFRLSPDEAHLGQLVDLTHGAITTGAMA
ncbi:hypothetical protein [Streptomyces albireticuli]